MDLQLENYWKVTRPRRAKPVGGHLIPFRFLEPLVEWVSHLGPDSRSFHVLLGDQREAHLKYLQSKSSLRGILRAPAGSDPDLVNQLSYVLQDLRVSSITYEDLIFSPPEPLEWDLIWCLIAIQNIGISASLLDVTRKNTKLVKLHVALDELRFEASERRALISLEEGIQRFVGLIGPKKKDHLNALMFLSTLAYENGLLEPFIVYLDTKDTANGLLDTLQAFKEWEPYGSPLKLLVGCEENVRFIPILHKYMIEGLEWLAPR